MRGQLVWDTPKSHERRSVPFPALLAEPLAALMQDRGRDDLMFAEPKGAVLRVSTFRPRVFAPAVAPCQEKDRDFPTVTPHDLRHEECLKPVDLRHEALLLRVEVRDLRR